MPGFIIHTCTASPSVGESSDQLGTEIAYTTLVHTDDYTHKQSNLAPFWQVLLKKSQKIARVAVER